MKVAQTIRSSHTDGITVSTQLASRTLIWIAIGVSVANFVALVTFGGLILYTDYQNGLRTERRASAIQDSIEEVRTELKAYDTHVTAFAAELRASIDAVSAQA
ncbi:MAG: hypothetical protein AAF493_05330, partial [Pseudomonadota bacterium]